MDNNMISIDELMKRRLEGGEEDERSGAWLQMKDLLDQELPRNKAIGFIFWRRILATAGVLLLISTLTIGGYEITSALRNRTNGETANANAANNNTTNSFTTKTSSAELNQTNNQSGANPIATIANKAHSTVNHKTTSNNNTLVPTIQPANTPNDNTVAVQTVNKSSVTDNSLTSANGSNALVLASGNPQDGTNHLLKHKKNHSNNHATLSSGNTNINTTSAGNTTQIADNTANVVASSGNNTNGTTDNSNISNVKPGINKKGITDSHNDVSPASKTSLLASNTNNTKMHTATKHKNESKKHTSSPLVATTYSTDNDNNSADGSDKNHKQLNNKAASADVAMADKGHTKNHHKHRTNKNSVDLSSASNLPVAAENKLKNNDPAAQPSAKTAGMEQETDASTASNHVAPVSQHHGTKHNTNKNAASAPDQKQTTTGTTTSVAMNSLPLAGNVNMPVNNNAAANLGIVNNIPTAGSSGASGTAVADLATGSTKSGAIQTPANNLLAGTDDHKTSKTHKGKTKSYTAKSKSSKTGNDNKTAAGTTQDKAVAATEDNENNSISAANAIAGNNMPATTARKTKLIRMENHYIKTSVNYGYYKLDTIAIEDVDMPEDMRNMLAACNKSLKNAAAKDAGTQEESKDENTAAAEIYPNAAAALLAKPYTEKQAANADYAKTTNNANSIAKMFNDIKYNVQGVHMAAGITAGINATFFGPGSMKGFDFGGQCNMIFNETWSVLVQLKYFHRIMNNGVINNNYSNYTASGSGYVKDSISQTIGFNTLHSFELPLAIEYSKERFIFSAGLNFAYSLAVNIDEAPQQITPLNGTYTTAGTENAPKYQVNDFKSRFGLGYLFGISYRIAPNVTVDFRDVQTFWDNAGSAGAKAISSQLYKNPSFQLSFGYTLGSKKPAEK